MAVPFALQRAPAQRVATILNNFYNDRYPEDTHNRNQVRITYDEGTNTLFVQAPPNDMLEITGLVDRMDNFPPGPLHDLKVIKLKSALSDDLAPIIRSAIAEGILSPITNTTGTGAACPEAALPALPVAGQPTAVPGQNGVPGRQNTAHTLRFMSGTRKDGSGGGLPGRHPHHVLSDHEHSGDLRAAQDDGADPGTGARAGRAADRQGRDPRLHPEEGGRHRPGPDAAAALPGHRLYRRPSTAAPGGGAHWRAAPAAPAGGRGRRWAAAAEAAAGHQSAGTPTPEGYPLIDIRITVDERTNSLIVAGSRNDLNVIEAVISKLEDADIPNARHDRGLPAQERPGRGRGQRLAELHHQRNRQS